MDRDAEIERDARAAVLAADMLTEVQVVDLLGPDQAMRLVRSGELLRLPSERCGLCPAFQFDVPKRGLRSVVAEINALLSAGSDPWGVASWWLSPSGSLPIGRSPSDLASSPDPEELALLTRLARGLIED